MYIYIYIYVNRILSRQTPKYRTAKNKTPQRKVSGPTGKTVPYKFEQSFGVYASISVVRKPSILNPYNTQKSL